jgi:hypothetical protein
MRSPRRSPTSSPTATACICWCQGKGKTTLLHALVKDDLERNASIVLLDSKGDLIAPFLSHPALSDRRVVIGPDNPIGMNPLDIPHTDINKAVESIEYLFSSLLDFKLTSTQSMLLRAVFRTLIQAVPNPNLGTFQELMAKDGEKKYGRYLTGLDPDLQNFFANEYNSPNTVVAKDERITDVLHECRSQKIALCVAHQETSQVDEKVLSAFQNCASRHGSGHVKTARLTHLCR